MRIHSILNTSVSFSFLALCQCSPAPAPGNAGGPSTLGGAGGAISTTGGGNANGGLTSSMGGTTAMAGAAPTGVAGMTGSGGAGPMGGGGAGPMSGGAGMGGSGGATPMGGGGAGPMGGGAGMGGSGGTSPMGGGSGEGGAGVGGDGAGGGGVGGAPAGGEFTLTSAELTEGGSFDEANTCTGGGGELGFGVSVSLEWSGFPAGTQSFALTMIDVTLVDGTAMDYLGCHSFFHDLPVDVTSLPAGGWGDALEEAGATAFRTGYLGPCPPNGPDTYELTLYALPDASFTPEGNMNNLSGCNMLRESLEEAALGKVTLSGTYIQP